MSKISLKEVEQALIKVGVESQKASLVLKQLNQSIEEQKEASQAEKLPKQKNEFGVILYDANNELQGKEFTASIYQIKSGDDHATVLSKISDAAKTQNESAKRKKNIVTTIGEACEFLKRKFIKEKGVNIKTKHTVRVIISNNTII